MADSTTEQSVFQTKYNEFVSDVMGALPEYTAQIQVAFSLDPASRLARFQEEVKVKHTLGGNSADYQTNPNTILPGVVVADGVWKTLSDQTKKAIWEHVRILSICCFMEGGFSETNKPEWMEEAMNDMKKKLESVDFSSIIGKFMNFFKPSDDSDDENKTNGPDLKGMFENGFPKLPERFLKGQLAKLSQEIIKDITPDDLGITPDMLKECEKDPSRAFSVLLSTFTNNPGIIEKTIMKIGKRLQQKVQMGVIRPHEIALEAEELMKEFAENTSFVEMLSGIKKAFGMEDMDMARKAGQEGSARLAIARDRLRKKLEKKKQAANNGKK